MKYEEELDQERQMWGQPHVSNLSFQAIIRLRCRRRKRIGRRKM